MKAFGKRILKATKAISIFTLTGLTLLLMTLFIFFTALSNTVLDRDYMLTVLSSEKTYTVLTESVPQAIQYTNDGGDEMTFSDLINEGGADSFLEKHLDHAFYENAVNEIMNGIFGWLGGETDKPEFEVKIAESKQDFITVFTDAYMLRINQLPPCKKTDTPRDPFQLKCKPSGFTKQDLKGFLQENQNKPEFEEFRQAATLNSEDLELDQDIQDAPTVFQFIVWLPVLILTFILILIYLIYLLYFDYRKASKKLGIRLIYTTGIIGAASLIVIFGHEAIVSRVTESHIDQAAIKEVWNLIGVLAADVSQFIGMLSLGFALIGLLLYELGSKLLQRRFLDKQE